MGVLKLNIDIVKERVYKLNPNILILDTDYKNTNERLHCRCLVCNHEWNPICNNLLAGRGCPECGKYITNCDGLYNKTIAERNKEKWLRESANVYIIKCFNDEEEFYKIGITKRKIKKRFSGNIPYKYNIIYEYKTNMYDGMYVEKILQNIHNQFKYIPKLKFDGYTECYNEILDIEDIIKNDDYCIDYKTNCYIDFENIFIDIRWLSKEQLIDLLIRINMYRLSAIDLGLLDEFNISGYKVNEWIADIREKLNNIHT